MTEPIHWKEKASILYRNGFLRDQDRTDKRRIDARWQLYSSVAQKSVRGVRGKLTAEPAAADRPR